MCYIISWKKNFPNADVMVIFFQKVEWLLFFICFLVGFSKYFETLELNFQTNDLLIHYYVKWHTIVIFFWYCFKKFGTFCSVRFCVWTQKSVHSFVCKQERISRVWSDLALIYLIYSMKKMFILLIWIKNRFSSHFSASFKFET